MKTTHPDQQATRSLAKLKPNPLNPRAVSDDGLDELVASIKSIGLLQPIVITMAGVIVAGHRRVAACRKAGLDTVPVVVRSMNEAEQLEAMLVENVQRRALNPVQIARACRNLTDRGVHADAIATRIGLAKQTVLNYLAIVHLPTALEEKIADYSMAIGMAPHLMRLRSIDERLTLGLQAVREGWTVSRMAEAVDAALAPEPLRHAPAPSTERARTFPSRMPSAPPKLSSPRPNTGVGKGNEVPPAGGPVVEQLSDLTSAFRRQPELARDALIWEWVERLFGAVREARGS